MIQTEKFSSSAAAMAAPAQALKNTESPASTANSASTAGGATAAAGGLSLLSCILLILVSQLTKAN